MFTPDMLVRRAAILKGMRAFFDDLGFIEVETAVRIAAPAPEPYIDCPIVVRQLPSVADAVAKEGPTFLRASPELQMKKLLAAGMDRIYQIGPCFREGERGTRHNPEFTMIEWYRRKAGYLQIMDDLEALLDRLFELRNANDEVRMAENFSFRKITVHEAYLKFAGWDPWKDWDQDRFDFDMATKIEPALKAMGAVFLMDYPPQAASLARLSPLQAPADSLSRLSPLQAPGDSLARLSPLQAPGASTQSDNFPHQSAICNLQSEIPMKAERWEFYWNGLELANCFTELCEADEQRRRFEAARAERRALGESDYPLDERFLESLPAIGSASGVALGVDRLVMVLTGTADISSVRAPV